MNVIPAFEKQRRLHSKSEASLGYRTMSQKKEKKKVGWGVGRRRKEGKEKWEEEGGEGEKEGRNGDRHAEFFCSTIS